MRRYFCLLLLVTGSLGASVPNPFIMGWGLLPPETLSAYLVGQNPQLDGGEALKVAQVYVEECSTEGINHDLAFAQMLLETSFLRFGGQVDSHQFNFAGLGALDGGYKGLSFHDAREGIRAHIQHLKAYGSRLPLRNPLVNPRFYFVQRESAPTVYDLSQRWASDPRYGVKIVTLMEKLHNFEQERNILTQ